MASSSLADTEAFYKASVIVLEQLQITLARQRRRDPLLHASTSDDDEIRDEDRGERMELNRKEMNRRRRRLSSERIGDEKFMFSPPYSTDTSPRGGSIPRLYGTR